MPTTVDTAANFVTANINSVGFVNAANYDYRLASGSSPVINAGVNPSTDGTFSLSPIMVYIHPDSSTARCVVGSLDIGRMNIVVRRLWKMTCPPLLCRYYIRCPHVKIFISASSRKLSASAI